MSYADTRDSEQLRILDVAIAKFIQRYTSAPPSKSRRTLFFFPGGMGCQLLRARQSYSDDATTPQTFAYDTVWLTMDTFTGDALLLEMHQDAAGEYRDLDDRIIIADGAVELMGMTPYDAFTAWCEANGIDWFIFGWDWRRRVEESADFFVEQFLPHFQTAVQNACGADPLAKFSLVGHSFGGMIVNLVARRSDAILAGMWRAVTVATPFYGYDGQIRRYFEGEGYLNHLGIDKVIRVISSLPGCYVLLYLDGATDTAAQAALAGDPQFPLASYPSRDAANASQIADPYNPAPGRYPTTTGFNFSELQHALGVYKQLVAPLPPAVASKFFSIRGVKSDDVDTIGSITWGTVGNAFNPGSSPSPITLGPAVPGDGTQPAWTARLADPAAPAPITVTGNIDHMFIMETPDCQQALAGVGV